MPVCRRTGIGAHFEQSHACSTREYRDSGLLPHPILRCFPRASESSVLVVWTVLDDPPTLLEYLFPRNAVP
jgi:hypothetical protein